MRRRRRAPVAMLLVALVVSLAGAVGVRWLQYRDHALPGVDVAGVSVSGLGQDAAAAKIARRLQPKLDRRIGVRVDDQVVTLRPAVALRLDAGATAAAAVDAGRGSIWRTVVGLASPRAPTLEVEPVLRIDGYGAAGLARLAGRSLPAPRPARVRMNGTEPVVTASKPGVRIARPPFLRLLRSAALDGTSTIAAPLQEYEPPVRTRAAEEAAATARTLVAEPVSLTHGGRAIGTLQSKTLAKLLRFHARGTQLAPGFDAERLARVVRPALAQWRRRAANAQFVVDGTRVHVQPSRVGLDVDAAGAVAALTAATAAGGSHVAELGVKPIPAEITTSEALALGIRQRISTFTTDMGPSSSNRIHNVHLMADYIDGTIVKPGQVFSFNREVGPRTTGRGFLEGQMIVGSLTLPSIGGGVCQTATTLFNNAFDLGLPVLERHNHGYYLSHYPLGRDATVSWGGPDLKFRNDLDHAILIKASYTDSTLTFSFYGTNPHRRVVAETGPKLNWRQPTISYALDPNAPPGSVRTESGSGELGFDVTVHRRVYQRSKLVRSDAFTSSYIAVGPTEVFGPGSHIPGPYFVLPRV